MAVIRRAGSGPRRRIELHTKERAKRVRQKRIRVACFCGLAFALVVGGVIGVLHLDALRIQNVAIVGGDALPEREIELAVRDSLMGSIFFAVPKNNILFYPKSKIEERVRNAFPEIASISSKLSDTKTLAITVAPRKSIGAWCDRKGNLGCFFLDEEGYLFARAPEITGNVYFTYSGDLADGNGTGLRGHFMDRDSFSRLRAFTDAVEKSAGLRVVAFDRTSEGEGALLTDSGAKLLVSIKQDFAATEQNLASILAASALKDPAVRSELDYIDLRFGNKVYYKLKGNTPTPAPAPAE